ncbi:MAG TPA: hypothetical protein VE570_07745, partial [Thermoleophilaceae bacterium]|nr:hypothetical protein [Thermoleophilaceae bacterium]
PGSRRWLRAAERRLLRRAAEAWMVSEPDVAGARALCPEATLRLVPNVVDVDAIVPAPPAPGAHRILMVADYTYGPNRDGLPGRGDAAGVGAAAGCGAASGRPRA